MIGRVSVLAVLLTLSWAAPAPRSSTKYRPLVMIHGITEYGPTSFTNITSWVNEDFPGMLTFSLSAFNNDNSFSNLNKQIPVWVSLVNSITEQYGEITLLGYSQGGIISRAVIESGNNPYINTFISLSGPGAGQYGIPDANFPLKNKTANSVYLTCYNPAGQQLSVCAYWNDPNQQFLYKKFDNFLPVYNNYVKNPNAAAFKENFSNLTQFVMIGGDGDKVIMPWQSAQYGFLAKDLTTIIPYTQQQFYTEDTFGLKTLDDRGAVATCTVNGVGHTSWPDSYTAYNQCIKPYLA